MAHVIWSLVKACVVLGTVRAIVVEESNQAWYVVGLLAMLRDPLAQCYERTWVPPFAVFWRWFSSISVYILSRGSAVCGAVLRSVACILLAGVREMYIHIWNSTKIITKWYGHRGRKEGATQREIQQRNQRAQETEAQSEKKKEESEFKAVVLAKRKLIVEERILRKEKRGARKPAGHKKKTKKFVLCEEIWRGSKFQSAAINARLLIASDETRASGLKTKLSQGICKKIEAWLLKRKKRKGNKKNWSWVDGPPPEKDDSVTQQIQDLVGCR